MAAASECHNSCCSVTIMQLQRSTRACGPIAGCAEVSSLLVALDT